MVPRQWVYLTRAAFKLRIGVLREPPQDTPHSRQGGLRHEQTDTESQRACECRGYSNPCESIYRAGVLTFQRRRLRVSGYRCLGHRAQ